MDCWQAIKKKTQQKWVWHPWLQSLGLACNYAQGVACLMSGKSTFCCWRERFIVSHSIWQGAVFHHYISFWLHSAFPSPTHPSTHFWPLAPRLKRKLYTQHLDRTRGWRNASQGSCGAQPSCKIPWLTPRLFKAVPEHFSDIKIRCLFFPWKCFSTRMNNVVSITAGLVLDRSSRETSG